MADLQLNGLDEGVMSRLAQKAAMHGLGLLDYARLVLTREAEAYGRHMDELAAIQQGQPVQSSDSTAELRAMRDAGYSEQTEPAGGQSGKSDFAA